MNLQRLSDLFWRVSPNLFFFSMLLGVVTGLCFALLIPFIMYVIGSGNLDFVQLHDQGSSLLDSPTMDLAKLFISACVGIVVIKTVSGYISMYIARKASVEHRLTLYRRIQRLSLADLENIGQSRLINLLRIDVPVVTMAAMAYPAIWTNSVTVMGIMGYLIYLDVRVFSFVLVFIIIGVVLYQLLIIPGTRQLVIARNHEDRIQEGIKGLIYGAKELKLNRFKSQSFYRDELHGAEMDARDAGLRGGLHYMIAENFGDIIIFLIIALVVFHLPYVFVIHQGELVGIVIGLIYLGGPIGEVLEAIGTIKSGSVSLVKLQDFHRELLEEDTDDSVQLTDDFSALTVKDVTYHYGKFDPDGFALKPINLSFERGQISFIIGGNGSGKSTLSKCLSLHYHPTAGQIYLDNNPIDKHSIESARQWVSAIYSDFYLFERILDAKSCQGPQMIDKYLKYLELQDKVKVVDGHFSTTALSDGQKKRLSLLVLLLEDRPICFFDEWAADQDPRFKQLFYSKILPDLRAQNKVIIVISHDDRYFEYADQLVIMESGSVQQVIDNRNKDKAVTNRLDLINHQPARPA
jgi:putative ATP-binding cassette transporter